MSQIIAVINQKGGVGKTTISIQLAGAFTRAKLTTLLVDADPQGTATKWIQAAQEGSPSSITAVSLASARGKLHQEVKKFLDMYSVIIVDCPPNAESEAWRSVLSIADLAIVPVRPDPGDLLSSVDFVNAAAKIAEISNPALKMRFVASNIRNGTSLARAMRTDLEAIVPTVHLLENQLSQRIAFPSSFEYGDSVHAMGSRGASAASEVDALAVEILDVLKKG